MDLRVSKWDESYGRGENFIFYPKEEVVKFLNRFVRKKIGPDTFRDILDFGKTVRGLDYGCGIGTTAILMQDFGIEGYGTDISVKAIQTAKDNARSKGLPEMGDRFKVSDGLTIPFESDFFDLTICDSVLDSMPFEVAIRNAKEICRVTRKLLFVSVISGDGAGHYREFHGEETVTGQHEEGTCQSYFNWAKVLELAKFAKTRVIWAHLITAESVISPYKNGRYFVVLEKIAG